MYIIQKKIGETPLETQEKFRRSHGIDKDVRLSYAGRLDPMASGKLLLLEGDENNRREEFLNLEKTYKFSILFGFSTDTFDLLGMVDKVTDEPLQLSADIVSQTLKKFIGSWEMTYPPYSAKTIEHDGEMKPLWQLARNEQIDTEQLPKKTVEIHEATCSETQEVKKDYITKYITRNVEAVSGDFRQKDIILRWEDVLHKKTGPFLLAHCQVSGSAGLYVRRLAQAVGEEIGVPSLAFSITRTKLGDY